MSRSSNLPPKGLADALFLIALTVVCVCIGLLIFFRESEFVGNNLKAIIMLSVLVGVPVIGTLLMIFGEKVGSSKEAKNDEDSSPKP
ncbi:hypothetical protein DDZ13_09740 [Coraliomargarita sinensis]|uniref:Uncharacterized protein n=1 Tax=Coraliomargarita sinensis TaxID=2174842 RepID=A0A317ZG96_9BACT|nr:hypothetical protein [Coraliomargarita sinensis]PXA03912.1 hypothetical protein DDZ13_09740 [Coraliomargarita sinensis]